MKQAPSKKKKSIKKSFKQLSPGNLSHTNAAHQAVGSSIKVVDDKACFSKMSMQAIVLASLVICVLVFLVYTPALKTEFVNWDDDIYVYNNTNIQALHFQSFLRMLTEFNAGFWLPLTWLSHAIDYAFWKLDPFGHHLTSIILHTLNTLLVFFLAIRLIVRHKEDNSISSPSIRLSSNSTQILIMAGVSALFFGMHPLHVESVVWVAERKDVLCALFFLLSIHFYIAYTSAIVDSHRSQLFIIVLLLFVMAIMSKPMAVTLPVILLLLDIYPLNRIGTYTSKRLLLLLEKIPFVTVSIVSSVITIIAQRGGGAIKDIHLDARMLNAARSLILYLEKMVWPIGLAPFYPLPNHISAFDLEYIMSGILLLSITGGCFWMFKCGKSLFLIAWLYYVITLLPVLGIIQVGWQAAADRFTYLPSISISMLLGIGIAWVRQKLAFSWSNKIAGALVLAFPCIAICLLGYVTLQQITLWRNSEIMWNHVISISPNACIPYNNLGNVYGRKGMLDEAIFEFKKALSINPRYAEAHNNLGNAYALQGRLDEAIAEFKQALSINPHYPDAHYNLAVAYYSKGNYNVSIVELNEAMKQGRSPEPKLLELLKPYR